MNNTVDIELTGAQTNQPRKRQKQYSFTFDSQVMVKAQCLWDVAIKMNLSIDSTNVLVPNLKPLYWALWPRW